MTKNKAVEPSAFATSSSGAAAVPAKASSLKAKTPRSRKISPNAETPVLAPASEVALSAEAQVESTARTSKPKTPRAKSTAVTHRHKKLEIAPVAISESRGETSPAEPPREEVAKLAYSYYVARGYHPGNPADDWFRAVTELRAKLNS